MRSRSVFLIVLFFFALGLQPGWAAETPKTFAVLPFAVHGPQKYQYLEKGIQSMLTSRLTWKDAFQSVDMDTIDTTSAQVTSASKAKDILSRLAADYLFWGDVTVMGDQASVDLKMLSPDSGVQTKAVQAPLGSLIPKLETLAAGINDTVLGRKGQTSAPENSQNQGDNTTATKDDQKAKDSSSLNPLFVYNDPQLSTQSTLNPEIQASGPAAMQGRKQSQRLSFVGKAMVVGDADADGTNEIFIMEEQALHAYRMRGNKLAQVAVYSAPIKTKLLNLHLIDMNRDGYLEIVLSAEQRISTTRKRQPRSKVLTFTKDKFSVQTDNIPYYLSVVRLPPEYMKTLVGQRKGEYRNFHLGVHIVVKTGNGYSLGRKLHLPDEATVFNFAYLHQKDEDKLIVANDDKLHVYNQSLERLARTQERYAASSLGLEIDQSKTGMGPDNPPKYYYLPTRLVPINLDHDDTYDLLVGRNMSVAADFFKSYRAFPQGEIHCLRWDGLGLSIKWKTRLIKGGILDYGISDLNNDGQDELYVCVNTYSGTVGLKAQKTIVLRYPLTKEND